ncbi:MAG: peptide deformylase [Phycisphaerales bacterium JB038]
MNSDVDASGLSIVFYPHPALRQKAVEIGNIDAKVRAVAARMLELMHEANGIGLAAPQVDLGWRLFVANVPDQTDGDRVYINPVLCEANGPSEVMEEGCLSLPGIHGDIRRSYQITIKALDLQGRPFTERADDLLARCWQHEVDHLDGRLIIDRMGQMDRLGNRKKLKELEVDYKLSRESVEY